MKNSVCEAKDAFPFRRSSIESRVPETSGIYFFWSRKFCIYVGQATNLRERLMSHWSNSHNDDLNKWLRCPANTLCINFEIENKKKLFEVEQLFIDRYQPHLNKINARSK
jgi:excinuclease UvrABC nuclease subunit